MLHLPRARVGVRRRAVHERERVSGSGKGDKWGSTLNRADGETGGGSGILLCMEVGLAVGAMWRDSAGRASSAARRLALAEQLWGWRPHRAQARFFCCPAQIRVAACGRRWGKTEALSYGHRDAWPWTRRDCRQLVVAPTDVAGAVYLGNEVLAAAPGRLGVAGPRTGSRIRSVAGRTYCRCGSGRRCRW